MSESYLMGLLVLFLSILPTESTIRTLNSINDLKKIPFGQSVPKHSLVLLHWFANTIGFDNNDLIELTFEPSNGDYGTHHYGNYEGVLDRLPPGQQYYTLGNINPMINNNGNSLPSYVTGDLHHLLGGEELNRARIIFSLLDQDTIDQVFITQHYQANQGQGTVYDPEHTYWISINLLRELREFFLDRRSHSELSWIVGNFGSGIDDHELSSVRNTWGQLACVGLLFFIVINERNTPCRPNRAREPKLTPKWNIEEPKLPLKPNVRELKLPLKPNVREPKLPPKQNVERSMHPLKPDLRVPQSPPKRNVHASATPHISVNIPESDYSYRRQADRENYQSCSTACKICVGIVGLIITITIITILLQSYY
ncbi:unnamed protein product [Boreogadus saida]